MRSASLLLCRETIRYSGRVGAPSCDDLHWVGRTLRSTPMALWPAQWCCSSCDSRTDVDKSRVGYVNCDLEDTLVLQPTARSWGSHRSRGLRDRIAKSSLLHKYQIVKRVALISAAVTRARHPKSVACKANFSVFLHAGYRIKSSDFTLTISIVRIFFDLLVDLNTNIA